MIGEGLYLDGYMRYRFESDGRDFNRETKHDTYSTMRTRLGFRAEDVVENTTFYLMIGDSRRMGFSDPFMAGTNICPNSFNNDLGVIQVYMEVSDFLNNSLTLKIGRMENNVGRNRIFGPGNWSHNGPRTFDGLSLKYTHPKFSVRMFNFWGFGGDRHWEEPSLNEDHYLTGIDGIFFENHFHLLLLWDKDNKPVLDTTRQKYNDTLSRYLIAGYFSRTQEFLDNGYFGIDLDLAYQFGEQAYSGGVADISAYILTWDITYRNESKKKPWLGIGMDISSGDDVNDPGEINNFTADYFSKHSLQGHMDYFTCSSSTLLGLKSFILRCGLEPTEKFTIQADLHWFSYGKDYTSLKDGSGKKFLGNEIDITSGIFLREGLSAIIGFDMFFPSKHWKGNDAEPGYFYYMSLKAVF